MAERVELCDEPQGDGTPCIILHREHDDPSLPWLNHTSAAVLLDDYAELDRREAEVRALREVLEEIERDAESHAHWTEPKAGRMESALDGIALLASRALAPEPAVE